MRFLVTIKHLDTAPNIVETHNMHEEEINDHVAELLKLPAVIEVTVKTAVAESTFQEIPKV